MIAMFIDPVVQGIIISVGSVLLGTALIGMFRFFSGWRKEFVVLQTQFAPLMKWWETTSLDALKIATNPTSRRLTELSEEYRATIVGTGTISPARLDELIQGLQEIMGDERQPEGKRTAASTSFRFIEARERLSLDAMPELPE